jgi:hypothetical protein
MNNLDSQNNPLSNADQSGNVRLVDKDTLLDKIREQFINNGDALKLMQENNLQTLQRQFIQQDIIDQLSNFEATELSASKVKQFDQLLYPIFRLKDIGIDAKSYHFWKREGLIEKGDENKWSKLSFVEYVWVHILNSMKRMSCAHKTMMNLFHLLFQHQQSKVFTREIIAETIEKLSIDTGEDSLLLLTLKNILENDSVFDKIANYQKSNLQLYLIQCLQGEQVFIAIDEYQKISILKKIPDLDGLKQSITIIPLHAYIYNFIADPSKLDVLETIGLLTNEESNILKHAQSCLNLNIDLQLSIDDRPIDVDRKSLVQLKEVLVFKKYKKIRYIDKELIN